MHKINQSYNAHISKKKWLKTTLFLVSCMLLLKSDLPKHRMPQQK